MTYQEYKDRRQQEYNALPVFYAFSNEQFEKCMKEHGVEKPYKGKVYRLGNTGGFYLKENADVIRHFFNRPSELPELMKDPAWAEDAFYEEMCNHEYAINWQADWDVCSCFCACEWSEMKTYIDYLHEAGYGEEVIQAYSNAKRKYAHMALANEWF